MLKKEQQSVVGHGQTTPPPLDKEQLKLLVRKMDFYLLPIMGITYMFQFLDKSALSNAAILGLRDDILAGGDFSWAAAIYYFGFMLASYPAAWIMVRMPVAKFIVASIVLWGGTLMLMALPHNAAGFLTVRFFLGVFEAPLGPGLTIIVAMWYKRSEQPLRHAAWWAGNSVAGIFGGIVAYGIGHIQSITPWKALFLIFGAATVLWAIVIFIMLPDVPSKARFLTEDEGDMAVARVNENMTGIRNNVFKWYQVREALLDVKNWLLVLVQFVASIANGASNFTSIVVRGFGFSQLNTLLLFSGEYLAQLCLIIATCWLSSRIPNIRTYCMAACELLGILGGLLIRQLPSDMRWGRYAGIVMRAASSAYLPLLTAMMSGNTAGFTKKTITNAMVFVAFCVGNIIGPQLYFASEAPSYPSGFLSVIICLTVSVSTCFVLRFHLIRENRRRDTEGTIPAVANAPEDQDFNAMDLTDKEMTRFRYVY